MKSLLTIFRRELGAYFNSAIAYIFVIVFVIFNSGLFMLQFFQIGKADMRMFFNALPFALTIFIPAISMRLWAEDKKDNTFELLLTFPMRPHELVLGKFLASFVFYLFSLSATLTIPIMIQLIGKADPGLILGGYLGSVMLGMLFLAVGIFISGLCKDQIVAFILTMISVFTLFFLGTPIMAVLLDGWLPGFGSFIMANFGAAMHMDTFVRGIIATKDILYFIIATFVFLFLNGLSLEGRFRPRAQTVFSSAVGVSLVSLLLVNWLLHDLPLGRFDITEDKAYTISDVSRKILTNLKAPAVVKVYISPQDSMPTTLKTLERDITDKLDELKIASDNKLKYKVVHLESIESEADKSARSALQDQGVVPFQVESVQKDEVGVKLIYSTITIEYKEKPLETIPRVLPVTIRDLEYQLLSRLYKMTFDEKPKVAIFAPLRREELPEDIHKLVGASDEKKEERFDDDYKTASLLVRNNGYQLHRIALTKEDSVPEKTTTLLVLNPGSLSDRQRYEITKFLHTGGTVVVAAQGFEYTFTREEKGVEGKPTKLNLDINQVMEKWGVKINPEVLLDESSQVISLTTGQRIGPFAIEMPVKLPNQILVNEAMINREASITSRLPSLFYLWGSALDVADETVKQQGLKSTVLFSSTPKSWKIANDGYTHLTDENTQMPSKGLTGKFPLAVLLEGQFSNPYAGAKAPVWKDGEMAQEEKLEGKPGRLLVIGCSKVFSEDLIQNPGNLNLFANVIDGLTLAEDLIQIRSKIGIVRDIRRLSNAEKIGYKFFTVLLIPAMLLVVAISRIVLRKKEKEFYMAAVRGRE